LKDPPFLRTANTESWTA